MRSYIDSRMQPVEPGLYTFIDSPKSVLVVTIEKGKYAIQSFNGFNPQMTGEVARRLRPLSPVELKSLTTDRRDSTTLNVLSKRSSQLAEVIRHSLEAIH